MPRTEHIAGVECPQCHVVGELFIEGKLQAKQPGEFSLAGTAFKLTAVWRPVLRCERCDLHLLGQYTPNGNHAVFGPYGGGDGQADEQAADVTTE